MKSLFLFFCFSALVFAQSESPRSSEQPEAATGSHPESNRLAGLKRNDGFVPYYWDAKKGLLLFELSPQRLNAEFIYFTGLSSGVGSIEMFADRSSVGESQLCRFVRSGPKVLVIAENTRFRAEHGSPELLHSITRSFPSSVIASLPVESEQGESLIVNANPLVVRDATGLLNQLRRPSRAVNGMVRPIATENAATWHLDEARSAVDMDHTHAFPANIEIENILTFVSDSGGRAVNNPESGVLSVHEHISLLGLPPAGYQPRIADPRVGFFGEQFDDFSRTYRDSLNQNYIDRWRLKKKDPAAAVSEPVKPITFYLDRAIPEPMRSAARRGALWWNQAFEQAGFRNALVVEDLPEGADPLDLRYPTIQWTNRNGRGWSVGMVQTDPRTGEILHAVVQLDSHRMRTVNNYWNVVPREAASGREDSGMDLFAELDGADPQLSEDEVMVRRIALLTCHEMGHVLGLEHNFVASTFNRGSVMDYFAPRIFIRKDGTADLSDAYMQGVGSYDKFAIEWGYSSGAQPQGSSEDPQEIARLDAIVQKALRQGIFWGNYDDPRWNAYDDGPDPVTWLGQVLPVRNALVAAYGPSMLQNREPVSKLAARFALVYLFHRYALASAINTIGSAKIPPALAGDGQKPLEIWNPQSQRDALRLCLQALRPDQMQVPSRIWNILVQHENAGLDPEAYRSSAGYVFSPYDGARSIAEIVLGGLLDPERLARMDSIHHFDSAAPTSTEIISALVKNALGVGAVSSQPKASDLSDVVENELADRLMILAADDNATAEVRSQAWVGVNGIYAQVKTSRRPAASNIARQIEAFIRDPRQNVPKLRPSTAPPGPPI
ncbi:MAG: zinc-dependent metalloprotease [Terriglobales bacterium]